jgi:uncharacterized protein YjbJ (UPF0337 family)
MNWDIVKGNWKQFKGQVKAQRSTLTHDHPNVIVSKSVELVAKMQASPETDCKMKEEIQPRRLVLRGALVLGCSPWVPIALVGCDSKKDASSSSSTPAGSPATSADSAAPAAATGKVPQASVQYQAQPKGEQKCGSCLNFIAESNTCKLVAGQVSPEGWCSLWAKKA